MILVKHPETLDGFRVVQDNDEIREAMLNGETVMHWEYGESMSPMLPNKGYCRIEPITDINTIKVGDAVFCKVNGYLMVHMVWIASNMDQEKTHFLIGSTNGSLYGWTTEVYGIAYATPYVEDIDETENIFEKNAE